MHIPPHHLRKLILNFRMRGEIYLEVLRTEYSDVYSIDVAPVVKARESTDIYSTLSLGLIRL